jgi:hypothetical protein
MGTANHAGVYEQIEYLERTRRLGGLFCPQIQLKIMLVFGARSSFGLQSTVPKLDTWVDVGYLFLFCSYTPCM